MCQLICMSRVCAILDYFLSHQPLKGTTVYMENLSCDDIQLEPHDRCTGPEWAPSCSCHLSWTSSFHHDWLLWKYVFLLANLHNVLLLNTFQSKSLLWDTSTNIYTNSHQLYMTKASHVFLFFVCVLFQSKLNFKMKESLHKYMH